MFTEIPKSILYCYGVFQKFFEEMKTNPDIKAPLNLIGLPTKDIIDIMNNGNFHIIILDMLQLFTKYCHHCNISAVFIMQNVYHHGPYARSISLNDHVILFDYLKIHNLLQMTKLGKQLYPWKLAQFLKVCQMNFTKPYSYLVVDCTPSTPLLLKLCPGIFPNETCIVHQIT